MLEDRHTHPSPRLPLLLRILGALGIVCIITNSLYFKWKRDHPTVPPSPRLNTPAGAELEPPAQTPQLLAAIQQREQGVLLHPDDTQTHLELAELYMTSGQPALAISHLSLARSQQPGNLSIYHQLATAYLQDHQFAPAGATARQALAQFPDDLKTRALLGQIYLAQNDFDRALQAYNQCLQRDPKSFESWLGKAKSLEQIYISHRGTETQPFMEAAATAVRLQPDDVTALSVLARMKFTYLGQLEAARQLANHARQVDPKAVEPCLILVEICLRQPTPARLATALPLARQAAQLDVTQPEPLYLLARVQLQMGQTRDAIQSLERSLQIRSMPQAVYLLAQAYARVGDAPKARQYNSIYKEWNTFTEQRKVLLAKLRHNPQDVNLYCDVAALYLARHDYAPAARWLAKAETLGGNQSRVRQLLTAVHKLKAAGGGAAQ